MTLKELDRLVTKTDMNPMSKKGLRHVRTAVMSGKCGNADVSSGSWSIAVETEYGNTVRMSFKFRKEV